MVAGAVLGGIVSGRWIAVDGREGQNGRGLGLSLRTAWACLVARAGEVWYVARLGRKRDVPWPGSMRLVSWEGSSRHVSWRGQSRSVAVARGDPDRLGLSPGWAGCGMSPGTVRSGLSHAEGCDGLSLALSASISGGASFRMIRRWRSHPKAI